MPYGNKTTSRTKLRRAQRDQVITDLAMRDMSQADIGRAVGLSRQGVTKALARLSETALRELTADVRHQKAMQTKRLEFLYREAVAAWERSKAPAEQKTVAAIGDDGERVTTQTKGQCGDPRHLEAARAALGDIAKVWGLNSQPGEETGGPVRIEIHYSENFFGVVATPPAIPEPQAEVIDVEAAPALPPAAPAEDPQ